MPPESARPADPSDPPALAAPRSSEGTTEVICARFPQGTKQRIKVDAGGASPNAWLRDLALRSLDGEGGQRWRPLLGHTLADRVVAVAPIDPGDFCRRAIEHFVIVAEREQADVEARRQRRVACSHPEDKRGINGRCNACGQRGLPSAAKVRASRKKTGGRRG